MNGDLQSHVGGKLRCVGTLIAGYVHSLPSRHPSFLGGPGGTCRDRRVVALCIFLGTDLVGIHTKACCGMQWVTYVAPEREWPCGMDLAVRAYPEGRLSSGANRGLRLLTFSSCHCGARTGQDPVGLACMHTLASVGAPAAVRSSLRLLFWDLSGAQRLREGQLRRPSLSAGAPGLDFAGLQ